MLVLVLPGILGFNVAIYGMDIMSWEEYLVGVYLLPLGSVIYLIFCTQAKAWGWENFVKEANEGKGLKVQSWMRPYLTYILPIIIFGIFLLGIM
jgi:NSS family neurotransmitter:Na+ symporter